jgi:hypothetical protein
MRQRLTCPASLVYRVAMSTVPTELFSANAAAKLSIEPADHVLTFTLVNPTHGNEITGPRFEAILGKFSHASICGLPHGHARKGEITCLCL